MGYADDRNMQNDSRTYGPVPLRDAVGKVRQIYSSIGPEGIRWQRIGKVL
ncbi:MAG: hypothetical protein JW795_19780 [Chitinivibrionales bacterium]|nr:hypothetical protein [Chitinivibrionales bacterium]